MYMKFMTLGQLDDAVDRKAPIYLKSVFGKKKVLLTNYIRGQSCVLSWEIAISGLKQTVLRSKTDAMRSERT